MMKLASLCLLLAMGSMSLIGVVGCGESHGPKDETLFGPQIDYDLAGPPIAIVTGNFDGDTSYDLAAALADDAGGIAEVSVSLGTGTGTFVMLESYRFGLNPFDLAKADFNADGNVDLVTVDFDGQGPIGVTTFLGAGDGRFVVTSYPPTHYALRQVAAADFNEDGFDDVAVPYTNDDSLAPAGIAIFAGPGMAPTIDVPTPAGELTVGDLNGDGHVDLVTSLGVQLGDGTGTFAAPIAFAGPEAPFHLRTVDVNQDGKQDIVYSAWDQQAVFVALGNGTGSVASPAAYPVSNRHPKDIEAADLDDDGVIDLVIGGDDRNGTVRDPTVSVLFGDGGGAFRPAQVIKVMPGTPTGIALEDLNGDGRPDLVVANSMVPAFSVLLNSL
jgi:hypothetical protein